MNLEEAPFEPMEDTPFEAIEDNQSFHGSAVDESQHAALTLDSGMILEEEPMQFEAFDDQGFHYGEHHDDHHHSVKERDREIVALTFLQ
jgi:hypothetical protein